MGSEVSLSGKTTDASPQPLTVQCAWLPHGGPWEPGARRAGDSASRTCTDPSAAAMGPRAYKWRLPTRVPLLSSKTAPGKTRVGNH